jgi:hypothetical protein
MIGKYATEQIISRGASRAIQSDWWVQLLEFNAGVGCCGVPVSLGVIGVAVLLPYDLGVDEVDIGASFKT